MGEKIGRMRESFYKPGRASHRRFPGHKEVVAYKNKLVDWTYELNDFCSHEGKGAEKMRTKLCFAILAVAVLVCFAAAPLAGAETAKGRIVYHFFKVERIEVGDVPGHVIGVADGRGLASFDTGEVATFLCKVMFDYTNGSGPFQAYGIFTFEDGSTKIFKPQGTTTALPSGVSTFKYTYTYIKGTGRFEGIQGTGSSTGKRTAPLIPGGPTESYADFTETYTLPSR